MQNDLPQCRLLARGLELPEETFVEQHKFDGEGMTFRAYPAALV